MTTGDTVTLGKMSPEEAEAYLEALGAGSLPLGITDAESVLLDQLKGDVKIANGIQRQLEKARSRVTELEAAVDQGKGRVDGARCTLVLIEEKRRGARAVEITETETDDPTPNGATEKATPTEA